MQGFTFIIGVNPYFIGLNIIIVYQANLRPMNIDELIKAVTNEDLNYLRKFSKKVERERKTSKEKPTDQSKE